jgi:zinc D-Ala-D-Ala carboxypeptidase
MVEPLSQYFTWREATFSQTAARLGIDNTPPPEVQANIRLAATQLDRVRRLLAVPLLVSSWYRCLPLNRAIGSKPTSDHVNGWAVDFSAPAYGLPASVFSYLKPLIRDIGIDQLILEYPQSASGGWVHVSFRPNARFQALMIDHTGTSLA